MFNVLYTKIETDFDDGLVDVAVVVVVGPLDAEEDVVVVVA